MIKSVSDYINHFYDDNPFTNHLGVDIISINEGKVSVALKIKHEHTNVYGIAHGGVIMSLCDMAMGAACLSMSKKVCNNRYEYKYHKIHCARRYCPCKRMYYS